MFTYNKERHAQLDTFCGTTLPLQCYKVYDLILGQLGQSEMYDDVSRVGVKISNWPVGNSYRSFLHYGQSVSRDMQSFMRYDYGTSEANQARYQQDTPPSYDLAALDFPIGLFTGTIDIYSDVSDEAWLESQLKPESLVYTNHYSLTADSYMIAMDMNYFNQDVMGLLSNYT